MLPKRNRFTPPSTGNKLLKVNTPHFFVNAYTTTYPDGRAACTVSKKVAPQAVTRNRLKRRLFAALDKHRQAIPGLDIHIIVKKDFSHISSQHVQKTLDKAIEAILYQRHR